MPNLRPKRPLATSLRSLSGRPAAVSLTVLLGFVMAGCSGNTNLGATRITGTAATLQASADCPSGQTCDGYFRWRSDPDGSWVNGPDIGPVAGPRSLNQLTWRTPEGTLAAGKTYDYQWCDRGSGSSSYQCLGPTDQRMAAQASDAGDPNRWSTFNTLPSPVTTVSAQQFHDNLGVNVKETYFDTPYGDWSRTLADVRNIGFSHIRIGIYDASNGGWNARHWGDLKQAVADGLRLDVGINPDCSYEGTPTDPHFSDCFNALRNQVGLAGVDSIEYPNEYDISGNLNWRADLAAWGPQIYTLAKQLGPVPVVGPSIVNPWSIAPLGNQSSHLDFGNFHDYLGATSPSPAGVAYEVNRMAPVTGGKPNVATEFGYHNQLNPTDPGAQPGIDESGAAVYILRQYVEHLADGIDRSYVNQLYDGNPSTTNSNDRFGLIRSDGSYKPAAVALKNLISMVPAGAPATLSPLAWGVQSGDQTSDLRYLDVEASDGSHELVLWRTASVWNRDLKRDLTVSPVTIHVDGDFASWQQGDPVKSPSLVSGSGPVSVSLGADPVVLRIVPQPGAAATQSTSTSTSTSTSASSSTATTTVTSAAGSGGPAIAALSPVSSLLAAPAPAAGQIATAGSVAAASATALAHTGEAPSRTAGTGRATVGHAGKPSRKPSRPAKTRPRRVPAPRPCARVHGRGHKRCLALARLRLELKRCASQPRRRRSACRIRAGRLLKPRR